MFSTLSEKIIFFVFEALNLTFHFVAQLEIFCKSLFKISAVSAGSVPETNREVSSAKIKISLSISSVISLTKFGKETPLPDFVKGRTYIKEYFVCDYVLGPIHSYIMDNV